MDYDLTRLGDREFERLIAALCVAALGARVNVFGDGPDGGREATVEGRLVWDADDRHPAEAWAGYTVVQAKFRRRPGSVASNLQWLLAELRKELSRWTDPRYKRRTTRRPDNLLIVTNVPLSAATGGGIDTAHQAIIELVNEHSLDLRTWRLWHYDDLCALLDVHRTVRVTYGGFLTTGDVLARMDEWLGRREHKLGTALTAHVAKDLIAQRYVRLGEAGDPDDDRLSLGSVAVDVPGSIFNTWARPVHHGFVSAAAHILTRGEQIRDKNLTPEGPQHLLVVGGPGQGKSTIVQIVCQAYRVCLLRESAALSPEAARLRSRLESDFTEIGLPLPQHLRWPIRIDLSDYGEFLAQDPDRSLLRYIAGRVDAASPHGITRSDLASWLGHWPWLVVLDGLDEVASPYLRERVTAGISNFLIDAAADDADVLLVVTTRPQGYNGELGKEDYEWLDLLPLQTDDALSYAERLTAARLDEAPDMRDKVRTRLQEAAADPDTSRLMTTPLQVTIMTLLLERRQRAPADRYQLFDAYFNTIYAREMTKSTFLGRLLEDHRTDIEAIHESVALDLQQNAEAADDGHEASMPAPSLHQHAIDRLTGEGHDPDQAAKLADQLVTAATHRLVLLVPHRRSDIGFEIRSLQEYMAARALTNDEGDAILDQLRVLVPSAHWRNTWLFAAGRLFRERQKLRAPLITLLSQVDNEDFLSWLARPGAELATDLLRDDLAVRSPQYRRLLADLAISRLGGPPDSSVRSLAAILQRIAEEDSLIRQKLDRTIDGSLAAGGGARAHAALILNMWTTGTGSLAARARQVLHAHGGAKKLLFGGAETSKSVQGLELVRRSVVQPKSYADADARVQALSASDRRSLSRLLSARVGTEIMYVVNTNSPIERLLTHSLGLAYPPELSVLHDTLSRPDVAEAFYDLVEKIPPTKWLTAANLRELVRHWYSHRLTVLVESS